MKSIKKLLTLAAALTVVPAAAGCNPVDTGIPEWPWEDPQPGPEPGPTPPVDPEPLFKGKPRYVWIDASANFQYFANDRNRIISDMQKIKNAGFTDVIVDVRPTEGTVLFKSSVFPEAKRLAAWVDGKYKFVERTEDFDYLQTFIDAGKDVGLRVNAAINTFVCGYSGLYGLQSEGPVFSGKIPQNWVSYHYDNGTIKSSLESDSSHPTVFMNPANEDVRNYMLDLIGELASYKDLDGIILDRCRYDDYNLQSDYSDESRAAFELYNGGKVASWPADVLIPTNSSGLISGALTPLQRKWLSFRVKTIHDFVEAAADKVHGINAKIRFGCYVGAWYSTYYQSGVNWASPKFNPKSQYSWGPDADYMKYGYADHCDFMMLGCYAGTSSVYGSGEWTMQGFCKRAQSILCGDTVFAGGPDVGNSSGFEKGGCADVIPKTIDACINAADGYFVFDLCHIRMYDYWDAFKKGIDDYLSTIQ